MKGQIEIALRLDERELVRYSAAPGEYTIGQSHGASIAVRHGTVAPEQVRFRVEESAALEQLEIALQSAKDF